MSMFKKFAVWFAAIFAATALMTAYAADPVIEQAKAQGIVGEQYDGYIGIAKPGSASAEVKRKVDETNSGRLAEYTRISQKTGDPVATVAAAMALKLFANAKPGEVLKAGPTDPWKQQP